MSTRWQVAGTAWRGRAPARAPERPGVRLQAKVSGNCMGVKIYNKLCIENENYNFVQYNSRNPVNDFCSFYNNYEFKQLHLDFFFGIYYHNNYVLAFIILHM